MQPSRFDTPTAALAQPTSRRTALRRGGLVTALPTAVGLDHETAAQVATPPATPGTGPALCAFAFEATVRQGPDAGQRFAGTLALRVGPGGAIDRGALLRQGAAPVAVVGQATGRAVNLLVALGGGKVLYGVGTGQHPLAGCQPGLLGGPLVGPTPGDSGDWALLAETRPRRRPMPSASMPTSAPCAPAPPRARPASRRTAASPDAGQRSHKRRLWGR